MKKMIPVMMLSGIIGLSACGNKTEQPQQNADTLEVADTIKERPSLWVSPWPKRSAKPRE